MVERRHFGALVNRYMVCAYGAARVAVNRHLRCTGRRLRKVPSTEKNYREGVTLPEEELEVLEERKRCRTEAADKLARDVEIHSMLEGVAQQVRQKVVGMAGSEARYLRAKNSCMQLLQGLKLTAAEQVEHNIAAWAASLYEDLRHPSGTELDVIKPLEEDAWESIADHYDAVMRNRRCVITNRGSLIGRILELRRNNACIYPRVAAAVADSVKDVKTFGGDDVEKKLVISAGAVGAAAVAIGTASCLTKGGVLEETETQVGGGITKGITSALGGLAAAVGILGGATAMGAAAGYLFSSNFRVPVWKDLARG
jgi:hypothetical protein